MELTKADLRPTGRILLCATVLAAGAAIAGCATSSGRAEPVAANPPSVTYKYSDEQGLIDASLKAEAFCRDFNSWPTAAGTHFARDGSGEVTFICDQDRAETLAGTRPRSLPSNPTVEYTYRDEQELIEATARAQRHCAAFGAEARSTTVRAGAGSTGRVEFECVRVR
jgi:hypothetical protein